MDKIHRWGNQGTKAVVIGLGSQNHKRWSWESPLPGLPIPWSKPPSHSDALSHIPWSCQPAFYAQILGSLKAHPHNCFHSAVSGFICKAWVFSTHLSSQMPGLQLLPCSLQRQRAMCSVMLYEYSVQSFQNLHDSLWLHASFLEGPRVTGN